MKCRQYWALLRDIIKMDGVCDQPPHSSLVKMLVETGVLCQRNVVLRGAQIILPLKLLRVSAKHTTIDIVYMETHLPLIYGKCELGIYAR